MMPEDLDSYIGRVVTAGPDKREARGAARRDGKAKATPKRSAERWQTLNYFADVTARTLKSTDVAVWLQLFRNTKPDGLVRISQGELAKRVGKSARAVRSALGRLESVGVLTVVHRGSKDAGPSTYRVRARRKDDR
ncbi:MAG: winged helix-turn-helix domain-containing protein [Planctomycetota bacterium]